MSERQPISAARYKDMQAGINKEDKERVIRNSILNVGLDETALDHKAQTLQQHSFSLELETGKITSQEKSGRCWLFAGLNTLRYKIMKDLEMEDFELSQSYPMFFDKLEKANYFLENILETFEEADDSRLLMWLLRDPLQDGGQWDMFTSLVEKYGLVPKSVMAESYSSSHSARMNEILTLTLRGNAATLRKLQRKGGSTKDLREKKESMMDKFYRLLTMFLGVPPETFTFEYVDKHKKFHRDAGLTPRSFYEKYIGDELKDYISVINAPTKDKPFKRTFTVKYLGNVEGGNPVKYLNVDIGTLKSLAVQQLKDGAPVWFGSDVGKKMKREKGILDEDIYDYERALGTGFALDKGERLVYGESMMTHAMVLTGVNLVGKRSNRWKVENSWGEKNGKKGYFVMSDAWFDEYVYQIVVHKKYLSPELRDAWQTTPIELQPWDPMGSLA